jgi:hypothetical protein
MFVASLIIGCQTLPALSVRENANCAASSVGQAGFVFMK